MPLLQKPIPLFIDLMPYFTAKCPSENGRARKIAKPIGILKYLEFYLMFTLQNYWNWCLICILSVADDRAWVFRHLLCWSLNPFSVSSIYYIFEKKLKEKIKSRLLCSKKNGYSLSWKSNHLIWVKQSCCDTPVRWVYCPKFELLIFMSGFMTIDDMSLISCVINIQH